MEEKKKMTLKEFLKKIFAKKSDDTDCYEREKGLNLNSMTGETMLFDDSLDNGMRLDSNSTSF